LQLRDSGAATRKRRSRDGLFQRNGWWWVDYYDADGKRHRKKAAPDYQTAKIIYRDIKTKIAKGEVLGVRDENIRLREFVEKRYWPTVKAGLSASEQVRSTAILNKHIVPRFGGLKLVGLRREAIESWQSERLAAVSGSTANKELMRLKHLLNRAVAWGYLKASPAKAVKKAKEAPGRVRYLADGEREALLSGANPTLRTYIVAALNTGGRRGELLALRWDDVDMKAGTVTFRETKNGDRRVVRMNKTLKALLASLPRPINGDTHVFPQRDPLVLTRNFARLVRRLGMKDLKFHDLRHDVASRLTMNHVGQRAVVEVLGHRDPRMTMRYQHLAPDHMRDVMEVLDPSRTDTERQCGTSQH